MTLFKKLATSLGLTTPDPPPASVIAQLGKNCYKIEFEPEDYEDNNKGASVGFLRQKIAEATKHNPDTITLVYGGRKLNNDDAYLYDYGIKTDNKILVISGRKKPKKHPVKPKTGKERVDDVLDAVKTEIDEPLEQYVATPARDLEQDHDEHRRLSEMVLQKIIMLDDVDVSEDPELRQYRRDAINRLHKLHESIDTAFNDKKNALQQSADE